MTIYRHPQLPEGWDDAVLPVDKPRGMSSFDVIRVLRRLTGFRKFGHAGTLDPMATGLLILLSGRATKRVNAFMEADKAYAGVIRLGEETPSYDAETEIVSRADASHVTPDELEQARRRFVGAIVQRTPPYSAVKVGGERLYRKARRGERVVAPERQVTIGEFELTDVALPEVAFRVTCSKGTYIRSLAHEFGAALGVGGHLVALRRTAIGSVRVEDAWTLAALETRLASGGRGA